MRRASFAVVIAIVLGGLVGSSVVARADELASPAPANPRRRTGTRIAYAGVAATLTGIAVGAFAIGLGNDRPDAARPFFAASGISLGLGAIGLATGFYLRGTSPEDPPDAISLDRVRARHRNERRVGVALVGLGAAVLITGIAHAVGAYYDNDLAKDRCPDGTCDASGARLLARSHTMALAADMLIGTGTIGLAGGIILYRGGRDTRASVTPVVGTHQVGAAVAGRF